MPPTAGNYPKQEANAANGGKLPQARGQRRQLRETTLSKRPMLPTAGIYPTKGPMPLTAGIYLKQEANAASYGKLPQDWRVPIKSWQNSHLYPVQETATPKAGDRPNTFHSFLIRQSAQTKTPPETVSPLSPNGKQDVPHTRRDSRLRTATAGDSGCCLL